MPLKQLFWETFPEIREFFYELAALDRYEYPYLSMNMFADLCFDKGEGYLKAITKPPPPESDSKLKKMIKATARRGSKERRQSTLISTV